MLERETQRPQSGPRRLRRAAPHRRPGRERRRHDRPRRVKNGAQHLSHRLRRLQRNRVGHPVARGARHPTQHATGRRRSPGQLQQQTGDRLRRGQVAPIPVHLGRVRAPQPVERPLGRAEVQPRLLIDVPPDGELRRVEIEIAQAVIGQRQLGGDRRGSHEDVVAVADVHPGADRVDRRRAPAHGVAGLQHEHVEPGPGEVRRAHQAVVPAAHHDHVVHRHVVRGHVGAGAHRAQPPAQMSASTRRSSTVGRSIFRWTSCVRSSRSRARSAPAAPCPPG